jgi:hypothetical protein
MGGGGNQGGGGLGAILQHFASGQGNFADANSQDHQGFQQMVQQAPPGLLSQIFGHAAQRMDPQEYSDHVTPGVGGTNPLGSLGSGGLGMIASALLNHLGGGGGLSSLLGKVPGLRTTDPQQMDADQVAALSRYAQQNNPQAFGQAAADVGQQRPDLLHSFLGKAGLAIGAAALASHFIKMDQPH